MGLGKTGISAIKAMIASNAKTVIAVDDDIERVRNIRNNTEFTTALSNGILQTAICHTLYGKLHSLRIDTLIISPGIPMQKMQTHKLLQEAMDCGVRVVGDLDIFFQAHDEMSLTPCTVGVTGSNGKSTTTALITFILENFFIQHTKRRTIYAAGNIGIPVLDIDVADYKNTQDYGTQPIYILEISSFQLDTAKKIALNTAVCINITADHLDRYGNIDNYAQSKEQIFKFCSPKGTCVISVDYTKTTLIYERLLTKLSVAYSPNIIPFSVLSKLVTGMSLVCDTLTIANAFGIEHAQYTEISKFLPTSLHGQHNAENVIAALAACLSLNIGITIEEILAILPNFTGLPHRTQLVAKLITQHGHIAFINDSKATNIASTVKALESFSNIYWIVGGKSKGEDLEILFEKISNVKKAYLVGASDIVMKELETLCKKYCVPYATCITLKYALDLIKEDILHSTTTTIPHTTSTILLSPAHSSLDQWKNFEDRGEFFTSYIRKIWNI